MGEKMTEQKNFMKSCIWILSIMLVAILVGFGAYGLYIHYFNTEDRVCNGAVENSDIEFSMNPRGGETDSWNKDIVDEQLTGSSESVAYRGIIYDAEIKNKTSYEVEDWTLKVKVEEDYYLNNAWCGTLEIHQNPGHKEKVQTIDLRDYKADSILLNHYLEGPDLMIPLKKGDFFVYKPDLSATEYPINPSNIKNNDIRLVSIGFIVYSKSTDPVDFTNVEITYHLKKYFTQEIGFTILLGAVAVWVFCVILFSVFAINMNATQKRLANDEKIIKESISVFTRFFEAKDEYTNGHSQRVAEYSKMIGKQLGYSEDECRHIYYIALMHDCGKIYIPDNILKKTERLTDEEYQVIKTHTTKGADMLYDFNSIEGIRDGALYHHERYDGKGYPTGKVGEDIPKIGRIICVADSFDAMNSHRCYRKKLPKEVILSELTNNKGKQFDPIIVDAFMELIRDGKVVIDEDV
jgi:hypothetical protein